MRTRKGDLAASSAANKATTVASTPRAPRSTTTTVAKRTDSAPVATTPAAAGAAKAPLPSAVRLPVLATMGLAISTVLHALATQFGDGGVGSIARTAGGWGELGAVVGWRS
ncbi:hypothetical protein V500_06099 [Pseudogymnoascus sp. VKM F-4518 (FW-2643)]|nr:hypothetical protein V500_06099 [Pseudogymnoascus sp. VKM F-4518 (FW-2643)]